MGEPSTAAPVYKTGWLWAVLTFILIIGTVASAFVVYGLTDLAASGQWAYAAVAILGGASVAIFAGLLVAGILYRVDRLRGVPHRTVNLFE
jgi:hypothetical protein